jgi:hypothetical protein
MNTLLQLQLIVDSGLLILIWLVQIIIYPSFHSIDTKDFKSWHIRYTKRISTIVVPLMLLQAGLELYYTLFEAPRWWRALLIAAVFLSTFILSVPCHKRLQDTGKNTSVIRRLVQTNWIRTLLWTLLFMETLWQGLAYSG